MVIFVLQSVLRLSDIKTYFSQCIYV